MKVNYLQCQWEIVGIQGVVVQSLVRLQCHHQGKPETTYSVQADTTLVKRGGTRKIILDLYEKKLDV